MSIAAVPDYLGKDFKDASPGMRFGLLLPIWTSRQDQEDDVKSRASQKSREGFEVKDMLTQRGMDAAIQALQQRTSKPLPGLWAKNDFAAKNAWKQIKLLTQADQARMSALAERQAAIAGTRPHSYLFDAIATAPFATGLGNEHPLENGFAFLNPYGLPYLPGSGVKGVLRQAARELASGDWGDAQGWNADAITALFGLQSQDGDRQQTRGALSFWDVIPQIKGDSLAVEIMTPHQKHYYQDGHNPHDSGQPIPITFLTVPPGSGFTFHLVCNLQLLQQTAPELAKDQRWKSLLAAAFQHAFNWLGFGAKTAVGYGAMEPDQQAETRRQQQEEERLAEQQRQEATAARQEALSSMSPDERVIEEFLDAWPDKNQSRLSVLLNGLKANKWSGAALPLAATRAKNMMQQDRKWKEKSEKKKPEKDTDYQNTLLVKKILESS